ncbi:MAG: type III polyketide synthase [Phycisphaeraceae bacterium]
MPMTLLSLATARPEGQIDQHDAWQIAAERCCQTPRQKRMLQTIYRQTTVQQRGYAASPGSGNGHTAADARAFFPPANADQPRGPAVSERMSRYQELALPFARHAAASAVEQAGIAPDQIRQLVVVTCTGFAAPGLDVGLIDALALDPGTGRTLIGFMGCHGALNGLRVARGLAQPGEAVLLVAVELCSLHFQYGWQPQQLVANALFADGAAAAVGVADGSAESAPFRLLDNASRLLPDSRDAMTWRIGDHGFEMTLSPCVPNLIEQHLPAFLQDWLARHGLTPGDVGSWAVHPGGPRVLTAVEHALDLPPDALATSRQVLAECGNMSSPTVMFILDRLGRQNAPRPWVAMGFGPGLMVEAALLA